MLILSLSLVLGSRGKLQQSRVAPSFDISQVSVSNRLLLVGKRAQGGKRVAFRLKGLKFPKNVIYRSQTQRIIEYIVNNDPISVQDFAVKDKVASAVGVPSSGFVSGPSLKFWFPTIQELLVSGGFASLKSAKSSVIRQLESTDNIVDDENIAIANGWFNWKRAAVATFSKYPSKSKVLNFVMNKEVGKAMGLSVSVAKEYYYPSFKELGSKFRLYGEEFATGEPEDNKLVGPFQLFGVILSSKRKMAQWGRFVGSLVLMDRPFWVYKVVGKGTSSNCIVTFPMITLFDGSKVNCLNEVLLREGAAKCNGSAPFYFRKLEHLAMSEHLGMWFKTNGS